MPNADWLGLDVHGGEPSQDLPGRPDPGQWPLEDVWATSHPHHPAVSPDGEQVAFILAGDGASDVWLTDLQGNANRLTFDRTLTAYWEDSPIHFSPGGRLIAFNSGEWLLLIEPETGLQRRLIEGSMGAWLDDKAVVAIVEHDDLSTLAVVQLADPTPRPIGPTHGEVSDPVLTADGRILATFHPKDDMDRSDVILVSPDGDWVTLVGEPGRRAHSARSFGDQVAFCWEHGDRFALWLTHLEASNPTLLATGGGDLAGPEWLPDGTAIIATSTNRGVTDLVSVMVPGGSISTVAPGGLWAEPRASAAGIIATHESFDTAPRLVLLDEAGVTTTLFDGAAPGVRTAKHVIPERVAFHSSDGLEIEGFLFRPPVAEAPVPAIVYVHGGPTAHYEDGWDGHAQHFVARGYAWLAINYRGSTSYGLEFERLNHGRCGREDVDDCIAAGDYLARLPGIDPGRIVLFGPSYGAYLTLGALVRPGNPFACGVAKYGDYDMSTSWEQTDLVGRDEFLRLFGHPDQNPEAYRAGSPIRGVPDLDRPLLVAHGELDPRTHFKQALELRAELEAHDKAYELISYRQEAHGLLRRESELHFHRRMLRFVDWHTRAG